MKKFWGNFADTMIYEALLAVSFILLLFGVLFGFIFLLNLIMKG